jgi:hypothetical protein
MAREGRAVTTTGHPVGDALLPASLALIGAVRRGDLRAAHEAVAAAHDAARDPRWVFTWVCTLAALVPDDRPVSELLAWVEAT